MEYWTEFLYRQNLGVPPQDVLQPRLAESALDRLDALELHGVLLVPHVDYCCHGWSLCRMLTG
jgi:hypothetical protein